MINGKEKYAAEIKPNSIIHGHVLDVLRSMPDESVNCCVTSPPYWGLRDYGISPQIWDGDPNCNHDWGAELIGFKNSSKGNVGSTTASSPSHDQNARFDSKHQWCHKCGAWLGSFGLEPTPDLYVQHAVQIFREVKRVLRNDGTLWLNLGDTYATGAVKVGNCPGGGDQGNRWRDPTTKGYRGIHSQDPKHPIGPITQPNRMPIDGFKPKDLIGIPWMIAFALRADGWYLRSDIIWAKPNPMPESVTDRPTKAHEYIFLMSKSERYYYDQKAVKEPVTGNSHHRGRGVNPKARIPAGWDTGEGNHKQLIGRYKRPGKNSRVNIDRDPAHASRAIKQNRSFSSAVVSLVSSRNIRSVWTVPTQPYKYAHFATFPEKLITPCIKAGCPPHGIVLDPFGGSGTVGKVARDLNRNFILIDLNPSYCEMAHRRVTDMFCQPEILQKEVV
jgi:site-specific DNA-methyltransferase (cytosine-N4-specific)